MKELCIKRCGCNTDDCIIMLIFVRIAIPNAFMGRPCCNIEELFGGENVMVLETKYGSHGIWIW